jgi:hypothetical protein
MKKVLTLLFLVGLTISGFAQKNLDISLDQIASPTQLQSEIGVGTRIPVKLICKNNGTDDLAAGDTLYWNALIIDLATNQIILQIPQNATSGNAYLTAISRAVPVGDTISVGNNFSTTAYVEFSRAIRFGGSCGAINRANPIQDANTANNSTYVDITWWNVDRNGVSVDKVSFDNNIALYPNPANNELNVQLKYAQYADVVVELIDITGKVVLSENVSSSISNNGYTLDVSNVPNGIYIVKVVNGEQVNTSKVSVVH